MSRCGRCKGKGWHHPIRGVGQMDCAECKGTGVRVQKSTLGSRTVSVPLPEGARCIVCGSPAVSHHHVVPQQRLSRYLSPRDAQIAKADPRNVTPMCHQCHGKVENGSLELAPHEIPRGFRSFVAQFDLEAALPRYMTCGAAAPETSPSPSGEGTVAIREAQSSREVER